MFSVWPELFDFTPLAATLLRVVAGYFFFLIGVRLLRATRVSDTPHTLIRILGGMYGIAHVMVGALLTVGLYTQPAALIGIVLTLIPTGTHTSRCEQHIQLLLCTVAIALLFLGAGVLAFDLPL